MDSAATTSNGAAYMGSFQPPPGRVVGVYFDKQRRIWRANWREGDVGKRKTKNFSVDDYGFEEARRLAIEYRLMKITEIARMELDDPDVDKMRLSTCRAPSQPANFSRKRRPEALVNPSKRQEGCSLVDAMKVMPSSPNDQYNYFGCTDTSYWRQAADLYNFDWWNAENAATMWFYHPDIMYMYYDQANGAAITGENSEQMQQQMLQLQAQWSQYCGQAMPYMQHFTTDTSKNTTGETTTTQGETFPSLEKAASFPVESTAATSYDLLHQQGAPQSPLKEEAEESDSNREEWSLDDRLVPAMEPV